MVSVIAVWPQVCLIVGCNMRLRHRLLLYATSRKNVPPRRVVWCGVKSSGVEWAKTQGQD